MEAKKYIDKFLKDNKIIYSVEVDGDYVHYDLSLGNFPAYIQYESNGGNEDDCEAIQIWAREDDNSDLDLFIYDVMPDKGLSESDVEGVLDQGIMAYKDLVKAVGKINIKLEEICSLGESYNLTFNVVESIVIKYLEKNNYDF